MLRKTCTLCASQVADSSTGLGQGVLEAVKGLLRDTSGPSGVRGAAAEGLQYLLADQDLGVLREALLDQDPEARFYAAFSLGRRGTEDDIPLLDNLASDGAAILHWGTVAVRLDWRSSRFRHAALRLEDE